MTDQLNHGQLLSRLDPPAKKAQPSQAAPAFIASESTPADLTLYLEIPVAKGVDPMTAIFFPAGCPKRTGLDIVFYLHGMKDATTIDTYLTIKGYQFREKANHVKNRTWILVTPSLGWWSTADILTDSAHGLDKYLDLVLAGIQEHAPERVGNGDLTIDNLVVAAHSKGGQHLRKLIVGDSGEAPPLTRYRSALRRIRAFDCLYDTGDAGRWFSYCRHNKDVAMKVFYTFCTTPQSELLKATADDYKPWHPGGASSALYWGNVFVEESVVPHHWVPYWYGWH